MLFVISTSKDNIESKGSFYWDRKYITNLPEFYNSNYRDIVNSNSAILFFNKSTDKNKNSLKLKITNVYLTPNYLKLLYQVEKELEFKSYLLRDSLRKYLNVKNVFDIPFCNIVNEYEFIQFLSDYKIYSEIYQLGQRNNWTGILELMKKFSPIEKSEIWNNADLLSSFSFATAKLSECTENLKRLFPDKKERNQFIQEKRNFRELTLKLRHRVIEINPENAGYYSNLAYTHYQSVNELTTPHGRRDGNLKEEAESAIKYINKALELDGVRLTDIYRKARLLADVLPDVILFSKEETSSIDEKRKKYFNLMNEGYNNFTKVLEIYESLNDENLKKTYKKTYIKSLYHLAQLSLKLSKIKLDLQYFLFQKEPVAVYPNYPSNYKGLRFACKIIPNFLKEKYPDAMQHLINANNYIDRCINQDYNKPRFENEIIEKCDCNNFIVGVYKAYLKGEINLYLFAYNKNENAKLEAHKYFDKAMETSFPKNMQKQNKIFILQKKALLSLVEMKYEAAIKTLEPIYTKYTSKLNFPAYASYTLAMAYILNNDFEKAAEICKKYIANPNELMKSKFEKLLEKISFLKEELERKKSEAEFKDSILLDNINDYYTKLTDDEYDDLEYDGNNQREDY